MKKKSDGTNQEDLEEMYANQALAESHRKNPVRPPLPKMPSFIATAVIFSFLGHQDYIKELNRRLSHKSRRYYLSHKEIINGFATEWTAKTAELEFGNPIYDYDARYPLQSELRKMTQTKG